MKDLNVIAIDTSKKSFVVHVNNGSGKKILQKEFSREKILSFIAQSQKSLIAMEACGASHHWAREFRKLGHEVKLIPVQHVIPFRKSNKNDFNDAEAIAEAAVRPSMKFVSIKEIWQQDIQSLHRVRQRLIRNQTSLTNEIRGLLAEYGEVLPEGINFVRSFLSRISNGEFEVRLTPLFRKVLQRLHKELLDMTESLELIDNDLEIICKENELCRLLDEIEGIGPITATALIASCGDPHGYKNGRKFASHLGLTPGHTQTGGNKSRAVMGGITKRGDGYLRTLLVQGGMTMVRATKNQMRKQEIFAKDNLEKNNNEKFSKERTEDSKIVSKENFPMKKRKKIKSLQENFYKSESRRRWLGRLINEKGTQKAAVAIANKNARIAWVILTKKVKYNPESCYGKAA